MWFDLNVVEKRIYTNTPWVRLWLRSRRVHSLLYSLALLDCRCVICVTARCQQAQHACLRRRRNTRTANRRETQKSYMNLIWLLLLMLPSVYSSASSTIVVIVIVHLIVWCQRIGRNSINYYFCVSTRHIYGCVRPLHHIKKTERKKYTRWNAERWFIFGQAEKRHNGR